MLLKPRVLQSSLPTRPRDSGLVAMARQWSPNRRNLCGGTVRHLSHKSHLSFCQNTQSACKCPHVVFWPFQHKPIGVRNYTWYTIYIYIIIKSYQSNFSHVRVPLHLDHQQKHFADWLRHTSCITPVSLALVWWSTYINLYTFVCFI